MFAFTSQSYRPWGQVRRRSFFARAAHVIAMMALGLCVLAVLALLVVFAASVAVIGAVIAALGVLTAIFTGSRSPARVVVRADERRPDGVFEARKDGSTWTAY